MRKVVILTLVTLFTCVEYSQAQTTEKEMTRQEKKAAQEALDKINTATIYPSPIKNILIS